MDDNNRFWFVLNYISPSFNRRERVERVIEKFNTSVKSDLDVFAPTFVEMSQDAENGKPVERPLLYHYVFVRGCLDDVRVLCRTVTGFSFVLNYAGENRYMTVTPASLEAFRIIARLYEYKLPCFSVDNVTLEQGDEVEVMVGPFAGLTGTYISRKGASQRNILISVTQSLAAVAYDIRADYVRVIRFAKDSKRAYDQIEAFIPRLLMALRCYHDGTKMDSLLISHLVVFCRRMEDVRLNNDKVDSKLQLLLMTANMILGNMDDYFKAKTRFDRLARQITNQFTQALVILLTSVVSHDYSGLENGLSLIESKEGKPSKFQSMLASEYKYYLSVDSSCLLKA